MIIKAEAEGSTRTYDPPPCVGTEPGDAAACVIAFDFDVILEHDEVLKLTFFASDTLHLVHRRLRTWLPGGEPRRIPGRALDTSLFVGGKEYRWDASEPPEPVHLRDEHNRIQVRIVVEAKYAKYVHDARSVRGCLRFGLPNGISIRENFKIRQSEDEDRLRIYSPRLRTIRWAAGFLFTMLSVAVVYRWSQDQGQVYRAIGLNFVLIASLCSACIAYFGLPRLDSVLGIKPGDNFFRRLHARLKYPEYYFDHYIVRLLRSWLAILFLVCATILLARLTQRYHTLDLGIEGLGTQYALGPSRLSASPVADGDCESLHGDEAGILARFEAVARRATSRVEDELERRRPDLLGPDVARRLSAAPTSIYDKDVESTCVYTVQGLQVLLEADRNGDEPAVPISCVAGLVRSEHGVEAKAIPYLIRDERVSFYPALDVPVELPDPDVPLSGDEIRGVAAALMDGRNTDWSMSFRRSPENCRRFHLALSREASNIGPYLNEHLRAHLELEDDGFEDFDVADLFYRTKSVKKFRKEVRRREKVLRGSLPPEFRGSLDENWNVADVIDGLSDMIADEYAPYIDDLREATTSIVSPPLASIPAVYVLSYRGEWRAELREPVVDVAAGVEHFSAAMRSAFDGSYHVVREDVEASVERMLESQFRSIDCKEVKFAPPHESDNICNNSRGVLADVMLVLLLIEKEVLATDDLHQLIDKYLVRGDDPLDHAIYLDLVVALDQMGSERREYFADFYELTNGDRFGCLYDAARSQAGTLMPRSAPFRKGRAKEFSACQSYE